MNTTFRFIIAAMAAIAVIASCQKEFANETVKGTTDGIRVISEQFDRSTKAALNGNTPSFTDGDLIRVSNTTKSEVCTLRVSESEIKFMTTLAGKLTAIYPADAAELSSNTTDAPIKESDNIKVPASQDGTIANAIIAMATVEEGQSSAIFNVQTALFVITPPTGATIVTITSLKPVEGGVARTGNAVAINTDGENKTVITVGDDTNALPDTIYVALVPGVNLTDLSFDAGETYGMKGIPQSKITTGLSNETQKNTKYIINREDNWHPYVKIGGKKWATENIGATASNPYGTYFAWADTVGHKLKESPVGKTGYISSAFESGYEFSWNNCPFQKADASDSSETKYSKYLGNTSSQYKDANATDADAKKAVLDLADDAAYVNWGGAWRMPTGGKGDELGSSTPDFTALAKACKSDYSGGSFNHTTISTEPTAQGVYYYNGSGTVGVYFVDENKNTLFFPAAGYGISTGLYDAGSIGRYWSSTLYSSNPSSAYSLLFYGSDVSPQNDGCRYNGFPVRPVSDQ